MPGPTTHLRRALIAVPLTAALVAVGCGGSGDDDTASSAPAPSASSFPDPAGKSLASLASDGTQADVQVAPTGSIFEVGENRYGFGVFAVNGDQIDDAEVAIYAAPSGSANDGDTVVGPFPAAVSSLVTPASFRSRTTSGDPDAATAVYTSEVDFPKAGNWDILALIRGDDGKYTYSAVHTAKVGGKNDIPDVGDKAPDIHTPTAEDVGNDLTKIDTRTPSDTMHETDLADVIGKEPVVLLFATPALCVSRVCGPVVDIAEEVKSERPDDAAYIHMEIYNDNDPNKGARPEVLDYGLQSEPWLFVLDADGKVSTRIEGAFSKEELEAAIDKASG